LLVNLKLRNRFIDYNNSSVYAFFSYYDFRLNGDIFLNIKAREKSIVENKIITMLYYMWSSSISLVSREENAFA